MTLSKNQLLQILSKFNKSVNLKIKDNNSFELENKLKLLNK